MIARSQHLGHLPAPELGRAGVVGVLEQARGEALLGGRALVAQDAGQQPGHRLDHHQGGQLPAGQHEVAHRQLTVDQMVAHPLVHPLVATAEQGEAPGEGGQLLGRRLVEAPAARAPAAAAAGRTSAACSTARKTGSGISTMPAPPPKGLSSTVRRASPAPSRRSCTSTARAPESWARPRMEVAQ